MKIMQAKIRNNSRANGQIFLFYYDANGTKLKILNCVHKSILSIQLKCLDKNKLQEMTRSLTKKLSAGPGFYLQ